MIIHTTAEARTIITDIQYTIDINTLHEIEGDIGVKINDIEKVKSRLTKSLFVDDHSINLVTESINPVDEASNETVAASMVS